MHYQLSKNLSRTVRTVLTTQKKQVYCFTIGSLFGKMNTRFVLLNHSFYFIAIGYLRKRHCVISVRIQSFSGQYFPAFGLNKERYSVSLRIHYKKLTFNIDMKLEMLTAAFCDALAKFKFVSINDNLIHHRRPGLFFLLLL